MATSFTSVYDMFLNKITDDFFMEMNEVDTYEILQSLLINAIPYFEFPRVNLNNMTTLFAEEETTYAGVESDYVEVTALIMAGGEFAADLTNEEISILATYMVVCWLDYQLASVENTRLKYSGSDFKFTSQANHLAKLLALKKDYEREGLHLQRLYKRRETSKDGTYSSTMSWLRGIRGSENE